MNDVVLWRCEGGVGHITLNRPAVCNAINTELAERLEVALRSLARESDAIIIRGAGGNFCAGGDLQFMRDKRTDREAMQSFFTTGGRALDLIAALPVVVVAAIEGYCLAGGFELMQACDFAVAAQDAVIGDGHVEFAQMPGGGGAVRTVRHLGRQAALGLLLTGDRFSGAEAAARGLVYRAFSKESFEQSVAELAELFGRRGHGALQAVKHAVTECYELPLEQALARERELCAKHVTGPVAGAGFEQFLARKAKK